MISNGYDKSMSDARGRIVLYPGRFDISVCKTMPCQMPILRPLNGGGGSLSKCHTQLVGYLHDNDSAIDESSESKYRTTPQYLIQLQIEVSVYASCVLEP
jgi:hypothetical protein